MVYLRNISIQGIKYPPTKWVFYRIIFNFTLRQININRFIFKPLKL